MDLEQKNRALLTDLYELTMSAAYHRQDMNSPAAFEMFIRSPECRSYMVTAGLEQVLSYLENLEFTDEQIDYLRSVPVFDDVDEEFWNYLEDFSFTGSIRAVPEGTIVFGGEPLVSVRAPLIEAQVIETFMLSMINFQTLVASKAARVVDAACHDGTDRGVVDFGSRRAHGPDAAVLAARASYLSGCLGTSNVEAGYQLGLPVFGTQAHSFVMAFDAEEEAFRTYYDTFPESCVLLIDTYDVPKGAEKAAQVAPGMRGVRIDSGDVVELSRKVRDILDSHGLHDARIIASGNLDEYRIRKLIEEGAACDAFGVGTALVTSQDEPALSGVYKLTAIRQNGRWKPKIKLSEDKATYPGFKQVHRVSDAESDMFHHDVLCTEDEDPPADSEPLLEWFMRGGQVIRDLPPLDDIRGRCRAQLQRLPHKYRKLKEAERYPVQVSDRLQKRQEDIARDIKERDV